MKILIVAATATEVYQLVDNNASIGRVHEVKMSISHNVNVLITGVGVAATTFYLTQFASSFDIIIGVGIAGCYNTELAIGSVVCVVSDTFADYGIDDNGTFIPLESIGFCACPNSMQNHWLNSRFSFCSLQKVSGITVSTASGSEHTIKQNTSRWNADIETMENAAIFFVCNKMNLPFICLRAISNFVKPRDKSKWQIPLAVNNLHNQLKVLISDIE